jgi:tetratricopeptide (TPR) repeat protein
MNRKMRRAEKQQWQRNAGSGTPPKRERSEPHVIASIAALFIEGVRCHQCGKLVEAVALYDRILSLKQDLPEVHCNRGVALAALGRFRDAEAAYHRAIAVNPGFADAYNNLGIVLCELGRPDEAERALRQAIRLKPEWPQCRTNLGIALKSQGRFKDAEAVHREAIALDPDHPDAHSNFGDTLRCLGRLDEAEKALRRAIALRPRFADAFSKLGNTLREQGKPGEAEAACREAIALDPNHAGAHSSLGNALEEQGKLVEAETSYRRAIVLKPDFAEAYNNLGATLKHLGRLADARRVAEQAIHLLPQNALHFFNLSDVRHFSADDPYLTAMEMFARNIGSLPVKQQIELHFALAKAYDDVGRRHESFQQLLAGNALKRRQIPYEETATLAAFERIRTVFTPELMRTFQDAGESSSVPLFIVGMPRSGTTLIEQILASHRQVFGAGELPNLHNAVVRLSPTDHGICAFPDVMLNISSEHLLRLGAGYVAEVARLAPNAKHVLDKMPSNFLFVGLIHMALPNARIIHAVRDPVDTCVSCFTKLFAAGQYHTYDLAELGRYYRHYQALMEHWHSVLPPGRILDVRYEDVVADLEGQARRMIAHCGLEWNTRCLAFHENARPVRTASATQVRQPLYPSAVGRAQPYEQFLRPLLAELYGGVGSAANLACGAPPSLQNSRAG